MDIVFETFARETHTAVGCCCIHHCPLLLAGVRNEGWFDPWTLLMAFQKKMISMGVHYLEGEVVGVSIDNNMASAVKVGEEFAYKFSL